MSRTRAQLSLHSKMHTKRPRNEFTSKTAGNLSVLVLPVRFQRAVVSASRLLSASWQEIPRVASNEEVTANQLPLASQAARLRLACNNIRFLDPFSSAGVAYYSPDRQPGIEISA